MISRTQVRRVPIFLAAAVGLAVSFGNMATGQESFDAARYVREQYVKQEQLVPMRDGVRLFTSIYAPKDQAHKHPILMTRTPYSVGPYGAERYRNNLGPSPQFLREGYIFVYQDVRGRFLSEGEFDNMRPHIDQKRSKSQVDESSDTFDTIDWLLKNLPNHNGNVGLWGISYPGFYSSAGMIDAHPALKAVSPQAPIADWFFDDFHHHGALFLPHAFNFMAGFGRPRPKPTTEWGGRFQHGTPDGYQFFLNLGPLKNADARYFHGDIAFWNEMMKHPNYDEFWQSRNLLPHLKHVAPAVMTVGGWYDAEDLYGTFKTYQAIEKQNPSIFNVLVVGPWRHGGWGRTGGERLGNIDFGSATSTFYRDHIELPFFEHYLKGKGEANLPEAYVFETGANLWRKFDRWPPAIAEPRQLHLRANEELAFEPASENEGHDEYISDPRKPVPYTETVSIGMTTEYMTDDQRFAGRRPDVLVYQGPVLSKDVTLAGPMVADLWVSTSGTDSDWIVKLIDVFPPDAPDHKDMSSGEHMGGYQMMVRSEVLRGRFRNSYEKPEPFLPNQPTEIKLELQDVLHTFQRGHRIMVQIQSTWFPLADRNPQKYVDNICFADEKDFVKATQRVYHSRLHPSRLQVGVLGQSRAPREQ
jgi:putative CocE/NonD family hydrolase